ncbi:MAG: carbon-nitrogen hydrolase family protein [Thermoflexus sp.]|uniref:carbon-nitrogen hydrolase family protein n=1 Tax=Thermoflexus sp. TaxID=1969742 RepID=UPI0033343D90
MREITVAAVQLNVQMNAVEENLAHIAEWIARVASEQRVDLIVFPELAITGYECGARFTEWAQRVPGPATHRIAQRARAFGVHVVFGMATRERVETILYNSAVVIGPDGEALGVYHKVHLKGEERLLFRGGYRFPLFETGFGMLGVLIGWDLLFPEAARALALSGAEILAVPAAWEQPHREEWRILTRARALENTFFVVAANRIGKEVTYEFVGDSMILGPRGQVFASLDEPAEGYVVARIDLEEVRRQREELQVLQARQPNSYRILVRPY